MTRLRLYASTCKLISAATWPKPRVWSGDNCDRSGYKKAPALRGSLDSTQKEDLCRSAVKRSLPINLPSSCRRNSPNDIES